jgi:hypothetical protein
MWRPGKLRFANLEGGHLAHPQPRAISCGQSRPVAQPRHRLQEADDLLAAEHHRQFLRLLGADDAIERLWPAQRHAEEEAQGARHLIDVRPRPAKLWIAHVGEIGKPQPARRVLLPEDDVLLGPVQRPLGTDAPLQGAANTDADLGMATPDLVENGHRPQAWGALQQRHYLAVPNLRQRIARRRPRGAFFCDGSRGSCSTR